MLRLEIKRLAVFLILLYIFLIKTGYTDADIFAERIVNKNKFSIVSLDFLANNSFSNLEISNLFHTSGLQPGGFDLGAIRVKPSFDTKFKYHLRSVKTNGDDYFCNQLKVKVMDRNFFEIYSGSLMNLSLSSKFSNNEAKDFIFFISLDKDDQNLKNKICEFNLNFKTYRDNPEETGGIFAERSVNNIISSGNW